MEALEGVGSPLHHQDVPASSPAAVRLAVVDSDSGFVRVLAKRLGAVGWRAQLMSNPPPVEELQGMRLHAIVIDTALLGSEAWTSLEQLCGQAAAPVVVVCTGPSS